MKTVAATAFFAWFLTLSLHAACNGERFNVTIKEPIGLKEAMLSVVEECGLSLSIEGEGTATRLDSAKVGYITLRAVSAEEAIAFLMQRANLHHRLEGDLLTVRHLDTRVFKLDYVNFTRTGSSSSDIKIGGSAQVSGGGGGEGATAGNSSTSIKTQESFDFWATLKDEIYAVLNRPEDSDRLAVAKESIIINPQSGLITVTGTWRQIDRVKRYLERTLQSLKKQVMIDVQIIAVDMDGYSATGIDWAKFPLFTTTARGNYNYNSSQNGRSMSDGTTIVTADSGQFEFNLKSFINFLKTQGDAKALSNPKVLAMNNQPTLISVGDNINYLILSSTVLSGGSSGSATQTTEQQDIFVGVLLDITPQIDDEGYITLRINPSISELKYAEDGQRQAAARQIAPDTVSRRISSVVRVKDRDVIVLGGLISNFNQVEESKLPVLGSIPFLGKFFGAKRATNTSREIVFVLTPQIVDDARGVSLKELGYQETAQKSVRPLIRSDLPDMKAFDE
ncbi:MAG: pilus (MSHA type) biogenesis protein MshL [Campylobacterales bacterium]